MSNKVLLELRDVDFEVTQAGRERVRVLAQLSFAVHEDDVLSVLGPSGSGKSLLARLACGLAKPTQGQVFWRGEARRGLISEVGVVLQNPALFPWMTAQENIALGLEKTHLSDAERAQRVAWAIDRIGLEGFEEAYPRELSQGTSMRVALARALAPQPELLILDDPFSGLDVLTAESMRAELLALWQNSDINPKAILFVTNNIQEAVTLGNRVLVLSGSPTRVRVELANPLSYPRNSLGPEVLEKVEQVHEIITRDVIPDESPSAGRFAQKMAPLPRAEVGQIIGLLEALDDHGGRLDIFDFVAETRKEYSAMLMVVNAAEMLGFVRTPKDYAELTELGRQMTRSDVNTRKMLFNLQLQSLRLITHLMEMLSRASERWIAKEQVLAEFALLFPSENPARLFATLVTWCRFAELLGFSEKRGRLYLDRVFASEGGVVSETKNPRPRTARTVALASPAMGHETEGVEAVGVEAVPAAATAAVAEIVPEPPMPIHREDAS